MNTYKIFSENLIQTVCLKLEKQQHLQFATLNYGLKLVIIFAPLKKCLNTVLLKKRSNYTYNSKNYISKQINLKHMHFAKLSINSTRHNYIYINIKKYNNT